MKAWVSYTNDNGGINGHPVELFVKDDGHVPSKALVAVKDLVEHDHVIAIVGIQESGLEDSWASYAQSAKIPVIGGPANGTAWLQNPYFFPGGSTAVNTLTNAANSTKVAGKTSYGVVYCAEEPACAQAATYSKQIAQQLGIPYGGAQALAASATDYSAQCLKLKNGGANMVFLATDINTSTRFMTSCQKVDYTPSFVDDPRNWLNSQYDNPIWNNQWFFGEGPMWFGDSPAIKTMQDAMKKYQPGVLQNSNTALGWAAGVMFGDAAKAGIKAGAEPTSAALLDGLYSLGPNYTADGLVPPVTFTRGKPATQKTCGWYAQMVNGKFSSPKGSDMICIGS
jgi:branched-chain amino acid transport system substrate-binding protein